MSTNFRVGVAYWGETLPDESAAKDKQHVTFGTLAVLRELLGVAEIVHSLFHPLSAKDSRLYLSQVKASPNFRFTVRLWQKLVREKSPSSRADIDMVKRGLAPFMEAQRLGAVVIQFPAAFKSSEKSLEWLLDLVDAFAEYPVVIETIHPSWKNSSFISCAQTRHICLAQVDQPMSRLFSSPHSVEPDAMTYARFDGRNEKRWLDLMAGKEDRYDYLYSTTEVREILDALSPAIERKNEAFLIFANSTKGQAIANALQLQYLLTRRKVKLPAAILQSFPILAEIHETGSFPQGELF